MNDRTLDRPWMLIAEREITTKLRDKTFIGSTLVMLVVVLAAVIVPALLSGNSEPDKIAVTSDAGAAVVAQADAAAGGSGYEAVRVADRAEAEKRLETDAAAALVPAADGYVLIGKEKVDSGVESGLRAAVAAVGMEQNAAKVGLTPEQLRAGTQVTQELLEPGSLPAGVSDFVNLGMALVFYMTALGFGMMIAQSVVQEKESRVVEILAASVPIRSLLWGKVIGNATLALGQILVIAIGSVIGLTVTDQLDILSVIGPVVGWFVVFFILGFVALAGLWAVAGSLATRQEDLGSTTLPGQMILMIPFFFSVFAGSTAKTVASFVPIASSMSMPGRMLTEDVPLWQPLAAIAILIATTVLIIRLGARLYERTLLQTGRRLGYREAMALEAR
ncbi:ABC transporter permease [Kribbella sandramycini]|uniref:ABC transporter permease n=1 Tax=Kribbella sandramycini TaxID=60450 RepID=A0A7Y4NYE2_9ACTN|nr:ABC transporter permease [Kribbella sandramycini]MBB6568358.1 ABC-2 type transport system permease protein [Kribbella sandramycini]NOL39050.1 ABC transporter permease [Kribbella sandramycini]